MGEKSSLKDRIGAKYNAKKITVMIFLIVLIMGCVQKPGIVPKDQAPEKIPGIPPAPKQLYISEGQSEQFTYWNHNITIEYISSYPIQTIEITLDGIGKKIVREISESPGGIYWTDGNLSFSLRPVTWETRDGKKIPFYEKSWNTTELYFEVSKEVK